VVGILDAKSGQDGDLGRLHASGIPVRDVIEAQKVQGSMNDEMSQM
jgi:hypothetical protein